MNSLERKNLSFKNRNIPGIQNKEESISLNNTQSFNQNKLKFLNFVDKNTLIQNLDKSIKKVNNDHNHKNAYENNIPNKKIILNKLLLNQIKKENIKDSFTTMTHVHPIQTIEINNINSYNISSYRSKIIKNDNNNNSDNNKNKNTKKNLLMESHHLINSLLKNQNKIPKKEKANDLELSIYTTKTRDQKIKVEISPSQKEEILYHKTNINENQVLHNSSFDNNINNKENKDINLVKNKKEILISPLYNLDNNNINTNRNRMYRSPLRMVDVLMLKKHHSINSCSNNILTDNNIFSNEGLNKIKKITMIKNGKDIDREKILKENIKRIQNIKSNFMNKEKENKYNNESKQENKNIENNIQENNNIINDNENNMNEKLIKSIDETTIDTKNDILENKFYGRNKLFGIPKNKPSINNITTISPIYDTYDNMKIKVNKINLETIDEKNEIKRSIHSIRRRFMNSKNKHNNNLSPDYIQRKITINENNIKNEETENIPEIKFQSESEKENRIKRNKKYKFIKKEERNINPSKKIKKYNSFSFGTLFSLSSQIKPKKNNHKNKQEKESTLKENIISEIDRKNRYFSPDKTELNKNQLNLLINKEEKTIKKINSDTNINNNTINIISKNKKPKKKKVTLSLNIQIENINTTKPVIRYKISQLLPNNKFSSSKKSNINIYIFTLDKSNIIKFDLRKKRFNKIKITDMEDISDTFQLNYMYDNTLICNTLTGLFILTGEKTNLLYYYDKEHDIIIKLCHFNGIHNSGCLLLDKNKIFILGGKNSNIVEYYDFKSEKIESIPQLNIDRANSSFCFCDNKIYGFFGYSYNKGKYLFNIEYIDKNKLDKWYLINLDLNININNHLINVSLFNSDKEKNVIYIYGGKQEEKSYYTYDVKKNNFEKIENVFYNIKKEYKRFTVKKYDEEKNKNEFFFDKQKQFIEISEEFKLDKNNENISVITDSDNNIHFLTKNRNYVNIYQYLK